MKRIFLIMIAFGVCFFEIPVDAYEKSLKNVKVVIDAGHGGFDNGAIEYGYYEDNINLEIALKMKDELEKSGAKVYLTRDGDYDMTKRNHHYSKQDDMYLRVKKIDSYKCDYLLSIHQNASGNRSAWGSQVFYYYRSKQLLFEAVFKSAFSLLAPQLNKVLNDDSDLFEKIRKFTENYVSFVIKHPYLPNFVIQELNKNPEFVQKLRSEKNFPSIEKFKLQVSDAINQGIIKPIEAEQLFINIISLNIFPFIGEPLLMALVNVDKESYNILLENRKTEVAEFIINTIKI